MENREEEKRIIIKRRDDGVGLLLLGFIFYPMLGFSDARYVGPNGVPVNKSDDLLSTLGTNQ